MERKVLRRTIAALVMLALSLAGMGRSLAAAGDQGPPVIVIGGFVLSLCHTDSGSPGQGDPQDSAHHDCCDQCTLHAALILPTMADLGAPTRIAHVVDPDSTVSAVAVVARPRTPRLSQGPPAA